MAENVTQRAPGDQLRKTASQGTQSVDVTNIMAESGLAPEIVDEIRSQQASGDYRTVAGRPWWTSVYSADDLKQAGLA